MTSIIYYNWTNEHWLFIILFRSSHPEVFLGKGVLKICRKLREHSCQSAISIKLQSNWMAASISWLCISSQWRCSVKKGVLENYAIFTGKKLCWSLFLIKLLQQLRTAPSTYTINTIITLFRNFISQLFQSQRWICFIPHTRW